MLSASRLHVTAIILRCTKNIYKTCDCNLQITSPESKFPDEYSGVIFIQIYQHLKKVIAKIQRGPDFMNHGVDCHGHSTSLQRLLQLAAIRCSFGQRCNKNRAVAEKPREAV